jgi:hypothetical protein
MIRQAIMTSKISTRLESIFKSIAKMTCLRFIRNKSAKNFMISTTIFIEISKQVISFQQLKKLSLNLLNILMNSRRAAKIPLVDKLNKKLNKK